MESLDIKVISHTTSIGQVAIKGTIPHPSDRATLDTDPVRCAEKNTSEEMVSEIDKAKKDGDTLGGTVEVLVYGLPPAKG